MTALGSSKIWILVPNWSRLKSSEPDAGDVTRKIGPLYFTPNPKTPQPKWHLGMSFKMRSTRSLGPKHCQLPTIVRRVVLSTVTRVFKKRSISQSRELKPLEGNFHFKTLMGTTFSHEKSLWSVLVHRGCHEHFRTQALSTYYTGASE